MADNDYRSYRSRDPGARDEVGPTAGEGASDPLAELARLIGQSDPYADGGDHDRYGPAEPGDDTAAPGLDWAADDGYAEQQHTRADDRYVQPPPADSYSSYAPPDRSYDHEPPPADNRFFSGPAAKFNSFRENAGDYQAADDAHYRDEQYRDERYRDEPPPLSPGRQPVFTSAATDDRYTAATDDRYTADEREHEGGHDYGADDYYDEAPRRRGGFVVVMAVLGLAVLGTAGAFGYRAMFGASVLPTLPPIIKAGNGPNKIMPSYGDSQASSSSQAGAASAASAEKLVSREEQPVDIQQPPTAPRVVATIPISPGANVAPPGMTASAAPAQGAPSTVAPWPSAPPPVASSPAIAQPPPMAATAPPPAPAPAPVSAEPKKIHTLIIKANQSAPDAAAVPPAPAPRTTTRVASAPKPNSAAATPAGGNAPLSLVPAAPGDAPALPPPPVPARTRTAMARR